MPLLALRKNSEQLPFQVIQSRRCDVSGVIVLVNIYNTYIFYSLSTTALQSFYKSIGHSTKWICVKLSDINSKSAGVTDGTGTRPPRSSLGRRKRLCRGDRQASTCELIASNCDRDSPAAVAHYCKILSFTGNAFVQQLMTCDWHDNDVIC